MGDLFPTPTRIALLRGVARNEVTGYRSKFRRDVQIYWDGAGRGRLVNARIEELRRAGWIEISAHHHPTEKTFSYRLTEAGEKVLEEADRG